MNDQNKYSFWKQLKYGLTCKKKKKKKEKQQMDPVSQDKTNIKERLSLINKEHRL